MLQRDISGHPRRCGMNVALWQSRRRVFLLVCTAVSASFSLAAGTRLSLRALFHLFLPKMDPLQTLLFASLPLWLALPLTFKLMIFSQQQTILTKWVRGTAGLPQMTPLPANHLSGRQRFILSLSKFNVTMELQAQQVLNQILQHLVS